MVVVSFVLCIAACLVVAVGLLQGSTSQWSSKLQLS